MEKAMIYLWMGPALHMAAMFQVMGETLSLHPARPSTVSLFRVFSLLSNEAAFSDAQSPPAVSSVCLPGSLLRNQRRKAEGTDSVALRQAYNTAVASKIIPIFQNASRHADWEGLDRQAPGYQVVVQ
jgi:hypothetical protein